MIPSMLSRYRCCILDTW